MVTYYAFRRWSGRVTEVTADRVEFTEGGGIAFYDTEGKLILAVAAKDWNDLQEI